MVGAPGARRIILTAALAALATAACGGAPERQPVVDVCSTMNRAIGLDDENATGMTVRQLGARYHIDDVIWSGTVSWGQLDSQTTATWSPHDTTSAVTARLRFGFGGAIETTGTPAPGTKTACPPWVAFHIVFDLASDDGGFADSWNAWASFYVGTNSVSVVFDPHPAGGFHGSYAFALNENETWSSRSTDISVTAFEDGLQGGLLESAQRPTGATSGEGFGVQSAAWTCKQSTPAPSP